ncbi:MAG: RnfABCDGE type electron transport complex subunit D [Phycisphaerae bacterium]|jgi:Na+-translocating ferredoxin:NAD+ oxidoreductase RnfD subunit
MADAVLTSTPLTKARLRVVVPSLKDPRIMVAAAQTLWVVLGQTVYYFNRDPIQLTAAIGTALVLDFILMIVVLRQLAVPLSAYLTGLSVGILLESYDWRVFVVASTWGVLSKYLIRDSKRHFFNPSNFGLVMTLLLCGHVATIAPGSQWGADYRVAVVIIGLGLLMMKRLRRLELAIAWIGGFVLMGLLRMALGQGGLVFALGPMTGAEFALFTFVMLPDPKASPATPRARVAWGLSIAVLDGIMRYMEIRYSMFYSLFIHTAMLPIVHWVTTRTGFEEANPWRLVELTFRRPS